MAGGAEEKPFNFLQILCEGVIAGGTAGVVVETAPYPIDTIKTRLQQGHRFNNLYMLSEVCDLRLAARGGSQIQWKGLYSGLAGNLAGVLPTSAVFVGIYEPTKTKLLETFPENLSAVAHFNARLPGLLEKLRLLSFMSPRRLSNKECKPVYSGLHLMLSVSLLVKKDSEVFTLCHYCGCNNTTRCDEDAIDGSGISEPALWNCKLRPDNPEGGRTWGILEGNRAAGVVDRHRRVHLLRRAGEDQVVARREEEPRATNRKG